MLLLDITSNDKGQLYTHKSPLSNGLFLNIKHTICNKLSMVTKQINFTHLSFNRLGDRFLACDLHGTIYMFDLNYNRYMRLNRLGITCTALAFNLKCKTEYLVAFIDGTIKCFNTETRNLVGWMKGHEKAIISLSVHPTQGDTVISFSADSAQLWDLKTFECKQKLTIDAKKNVEILKICFAPCTNDIISVFKDDSVYVWTSENIDLKCSFNTENKEDESKFYKCFSISNDGKVMVIGSRQNFVDVYHIDSKELIKKIELNKTDSNLKDCLILPGLCYDNKILIVLFSDGVLDVYNIENGQFIANLNSYNIIHNQSQIINDQKITQIYSSSNSRYFCATTQCGYVQVYDLDCSFVKSFKATSGLMKSSINSTQSRTVQEEKKSFSICKPKSNNVSKRTQNLLENSQIQSKLVKILKCYNEYPARYRMFIWKVLLRIPENYESYASFVERGIHPAFSDLSKKYPIKSQKCVRLLEKTLSALAYWSPIFSECDYLPLMIFPFVKLYLNNQVVCFEVCATFINNWCQHWFEFFPNPPMNILNMVENLLCHHDRILLDHFVRYRINCQIYAWCLLETIFSEVFSKNDWQILMDNILSNHPGYLLYLAAAYSICNRTALVQVKDIDDAKFFYRHRNPVSVHHLISEAHKMQKTTPSDIDPCKLLQNFEALTKGTYPVFNKQPKFISDYQLIEKTRILQDEIQYLKERDAHLESHKVCEGKKLENEYMLKQMLWDKTQNAKQNNYYKQNVLEYEKRNRMIGEHMLKRQQDSFEKLNLNSSNVNRVTVGGEPVVMMDRDGNTLFNKMRKIDENFDEIQNLMKKKSNNLSRNEEYFQNENFDDEELDISNEEDFKKIENELKKNRADAILDNLEDKCENTSANYTNSSIFSLERGRQAIEDQERQTLKRIYEVRQTLALQNRANLQNRNPLST